MIQTKRLILRRARLEDAPDLHQVFSHPLAMRYWSCQPHEQIEQTQAFLSDMVGASPEISDDFIIELNGKAIGKAGCWQMGEIGFILHPDHWGQGLAHEALTAVIPHVFVSLPVDHLTADVDPRNKASLGLLKKLGFNETGRAERTFQLGDEWCDSVYLSLPCPADKPALP